MTTTTDLLRQAREFVTQAIWSNCSSCAEAGHALVTPVHHGTREALIARIDAHLAAIPDHDPATHVVVAERDKAMDVVEAAQDISQKAGYSVGGYWFIETPDMKRLRAALDRLMAK